MAAAFGAGLALHAGPASAMQRQPAPPAVAAARPADLDVLRTLVAAGGGAAHFTTTDLVATLAGGDAGPEYARLAKRFGVPAVKTFAQAFDAAVADALTRLAREGMTFDAEPPAEPVDGRALGVRLAAAGRSSPGAAFDVELLLDRLFSTPVHVRIMADVAKRFGPAAESTYHRVLARVVADSTSQS